MNALIKLNTRKPQLGRVLLVVIICFAFSCEKVEDPNFLPIKAGNLEIFQLAKIYVPELASDDTVFQGTMGGHPVALGRIRGDSLVFIIPDIGAGSRQLQVRIGNQQRVWDMELSYWANYPDEEVFFKEFIELNDKLLEETQAIDEFQDLANDYAEWYEFFVQKLSVLNMEERQFLSGVLNFNSNPRLFTHLLNTFELSCINGPDPDLSSITSKFIFDGFDHLYPYSYLPSDHFHQAVLAGLGLGFWFQHVLMEYLADQTLKCPEIRGIEFIELSSEKPLSEDVETILEAGEVVPLGYNGVFKPLSLEEMEDPASLFAQFGQAFKDKSSISQDFAALLQQYQQSYGWELPNIPENPLIIPSNDVSETKGPILNSDYPLLPFISNPNVRLVGFSSDQELITFRLESMNGQPQTFYLEFVFLLRGYYYFKKFPILLNTSCPILVDVLLVGRENIADVRFAQEPYQIRWSNGLTGDRQENLSPGTYGLSVTDANGCETEVEFFVPEFGTMEDIEGNIYETVKIGNTWWMKENLRTSKLSNGSDIHLITDNTEWSSTQQPAYSWLNNDGGMDMKLGKLYNYYAACCDICPEGWRVPTLTDKMNLLAVIGQESAGKLRSVSGWTSPARPSTNESGLDILPGGSRSGDSGIFEEGEIAGFWWDYQDYYRTPQFLYLDASSNSVLIGYSLSLQNGYSVRCVRD